MSKVGGWGREWENSKWLGTVWTTKSSNCNASPGSRDTSAHVHNPNSKETVFKTFKPIDLQRLKPSGWGKSGRRAGPRFPKYARVELPTRQELNAEKAWGATRQTPRDLGVQRLPSAFQQPGSGGRTQRGVHRYNEETRQSRRLSSPRRTWTLGTRGLGLPSAANHPANRSNLRTALVLGAHGGRG